MEKYTFADWQSGKRPPKGWDCADAVADGWGKPELDAYMRATVMPFDEWTEWRQREWPETIAAPVTKPATPALVASKPDRQNEPARPSASPRAQSIAEKIRRRVSAALGDAPDFQAVDVDVDVIDNIITAGFWSGARSKIYLLTEGEALIQFPEKDAAKFLRRRHGSPVNEAKLIEVAAKNGADPDDMKKLLRALTDAIFTPILDYLKYENQRDALEWHVDMFADAARVELIEDRVSITLTHHPITVDEKNADDAVVADYREHFPEIDELIAFLVASRFTLDRKQSYLWLQCASDWGKGFLLGILNDYGLSVETSTTEIEAALEGKPVGQSAEGFKRAFALVVDEFKSIKSELKQIQSKMTLSPKHQLRCSVDVYAKLFLSAENVASLVGENGVEDQFANRMSVINGTATLTGRALYMANKGHYFRAVKAYMGREINRLVAEYQSEGRHKSEARAADFLDAFAAKHGLGTKFQRLSDNYPEIARQAVEWTRKRHLENIVSMDGAEYMKNASRMLSDFFNDTMDRPDMTVISRRKPEILRAMSVDGRGSASHRIRDMGLVKAVKISDRIGGTLDLDRDPNNW